MSSRLKTMQHYSLDFVINRFFTKLFKTNNLETVTHCRMQFILTCPVRYLEKSDFFC